MESKKLKKVITYGTYDLLHHGHIRLLERAKALGDYLIVGVTAGDFDKVRGKINVKESLMERIESVKSTGLADEIIIEEYEGQKIDDIKQYDVDVFTVGSDWVGYFDYLEEYCEVVYLPRTQGVSSSELRDMGRSIRLGLVGESRFLNKILKEADYVNGVNVEGVFSKSPQILSGEEGEPPFLAPDYKSLLAEVDAVYVRSQPSLHYEHIKEALNRGKHVLCEAPMSLSLSEQEELEALAEKNNLVLMDAIKTAYATAYDRLMLLVKSGKIGSVISVDATCTSLIDHEDSDRDGEWSNIYEWGPTALLPIFHLLGTSYTDKKIISRFNNRGSLDDNFTKIDFIYKSAVASLKIGNGVKSEGDLIITGTRGYVYVPSPWWKTEYFEIRYENSNENRRYFYRLEGEGIRHELVAFVKLIETRDNNYYITPEVSRGITKIMEDYNRGEDLVEIKSPDLQKK